MLGIHLSLENQCVLIQKSWSNCKPFLLEFLFGVTVLQNSTSAFYFPVLNCPCPYQGLLLLRQISLLFQAGIQSQINNPCEGNLWLKYTRARALAQASASCPEICCLICYNNFSRTKKAAQFQAPKIWNEVEILCHNSYNFDKLIFVCLFSNIHNLFSSVFQWNSPNKSLCKVVIYRKRQGVISLIMRRENSLNFSSFVVSAWHAVPLRSISHISEV